MAQTGKQWDAITAGKIGAGMPELVSLAEASTQVAKRGAPGVLTSGYFIEAATSAVCDLLHGFFEQDGQSLASDGLKKARVLVARPGTKYVGSLNATLTQAMIGSKICLVVNSSTWVFNTATSGKYTLVGPAEGFQIGDTYPLIEVTIDADAIQLDT